MDALAELLRQYDTDKYNLYFCPLPFKDKHRRRENVMGSHFLWADLDEVDGRELDPPPGVLWKSSPGRWAALWYTERWLECDELEKVNKQMTYAVGADKAGWDLTQVLRIPGTRNHKYNGGPRGNLVRMDFRNKLLLRDVPTGGKGLDLYKKYESKLKGETRSILTAKRATLGKRSEVLWKLYHQLFNAAVPVDDIRALVKASVWNKFEGRKDEDRQITREIEKCLGEKLDVTEKKGAELAGASEVYMGINASKVVVEEVDWLWFPYISRGALTIVEGDPGLGKSYFMQMVAAAICDGGKLPGEGGLNGYEKIKRGRVLYASVEDAPGTVIVPRLKWNKCVSIDRFTIYDRKLTMDEDGLSHAEFLVEQLKVDMVVFDTLNYFVGGIDVHRANEVSQQMEHFQRLAASHGVAVVVLRHLTKSTAGNVSAIYRGQGSMAFSGAAREVITIGIHPEDPEMRIAAVTKLNLEAKPKAIGYKIEKTAEGSKLTWSRELYDLTSDEVIAMRPVGKTKNSIDEAKIFLEGELQRGAGEVENIEKAADKLGITKTTLRRARQELGVKVSRRGFGDDGKWYWSLKQI